VLLHGNGTMGEDFDISGLVGHAAARYRVIVFDRPGYGHSERPPGRRFGPEEQADLVHAALLRLDVPLLAGPALPGLGALMRHTVSPLLARALWPLSTRRWFAPATVSEAFRQRYPTWMSLRPSQLAASAQGSAAMVPAAAATRRPAWCGAARCRRGRTPA
jgi:hypothetical protein